MKSVIFLTTVNEPFGKAGMHSALSSLQKSPSPTNTHRGKSSHSD